MSYGGPLPPLTASYSGFVNGETPANLTAPPVLTTTATSASPLGSYQIDVSGAVDANYDISYATGTLTVVPAPTLTSLQVSAATVAVGQSVTLTATVAAAPPNTATPSGGTVTFFDGNTSLGTAPLSSGTATLQVSTLPLGTDFLRANYGGSDNFIASAMTIGPNSIITTVAGNGSTFSGDNGPATAAELRQPTGVAVDSAGDLFIVEYTNDRIREVNHVTGVITTVAGDGIQGYSGDNGPATAAKLNDPTSVAVDSAGTCSSPTNTTAESARWISPRA